MNVTVPALTQHRGTIVVADDDDATRIILSQILKRKNFNVIAVANGQLACEAVRREHPDIVLLDCMMPIMNGRAALTALKADHDTRAIPVMMLTTQSQVAEKVSALADGAQDYLTKPFDAQELIARIEQQLGWRNLLTVDADAAFNAERIALLNEGERRARMLAEAMPQMIWLTDVHGDVTYCNRAWQQYTDVDLADVDNGTWYSLVHPSDRTNCARRWATSLSTQEAYTLEFRLRRAADGAYRWHVGQVSPVHDKAGNVFQWIGSCTDVDDIKCASTLPGNPVALARSETRYRALIAAMPQLVWLVDNGGRFLFTNDRWSRYTGIAVEPTLPSYGHGIIDADDLAIMNAMLMLDPPTEFECEARIRRADGMLRWHLIRAVPFAPTSADAGTWVISATDIDERKTADMQIALTAARLTRLAHYDELTGLPNRAFLMDRLTDAIALARRRAAGVIVLYIDLDHFKAINDTRGHIAGDAVLSEIGRRLAAALRVGDTAGRLGGDEFVLVCAAGDRVADDADRLAQRLLTAITAPIDFAGESLVVGASIGISLYPADALDANALIERADMAMYAAKHVGGNAYRFAAERHED